MAVIGVLVGANTEGYEWANKLARVMRTQLRDGKIYLPSKVGIALQTVCRHSVIVSRFTIKNTCRIYYVCDQTDHWLPHQCDMLRGAESLFPDGTTCVMDLNWPIVLTEERPYMKCKCLLFSRLWGDFFYLYFFFYMDFQCVCNNNGKKITIYVWYQVLSNTNEAQQRINKTSYQ